MGLLVRVRSVLGTTIVWFDVLGILMIVNAMYTWVFITPTRFHTHTHSLSLSLKIGHMTKFSQNMSWRMDVSSYNSSIAGSTKQSASFVHASTRAFALPAISFFFIFFYCFALPNDPIHEHLLKCS